jgi:hypothetical protein
VVAETLHASLPVVSDHERSWLPAGGRRLLAFSDSRNRAARLPSTSACATSSSPAGPITSATVQTLYPLTTPETVHSKYLIDDRARNVPLSPSFVSRLGHLLRRYLRAWRRLQPRNNYPFSFAVNVTSNTAAGLSGDGSIGPIEKGMQNVPLAAASVVGTQISPRGMQYFRRVPDAQDINLTLQYRSPIAMCIGLCRHAVAAYRKSNRQQPSVSSFAAGASLGKHSGYVSAVTRRSRQTAITWLMKVRSTTTHSRRNMRSC